MLSVTLVSYIVKHICNVFHCGVLLCLPRLYCRAMQAVDLLSMFQSWLRDAGYFHPVEHENQQHKTDLLVDANTVKHCYRRWKTNKDEHVNLL